MSFKLVTILLVLLSLELQGIAAARLPSGEDDNKRLATEDIQVAPEEDLERAETLRLSSAIRQKIAAITAAPIAFIERSTPELPPTEGPTDERSTRPAPTTSPSTGPPITSNPPATRPTTTTGPPPTTTTSRAVTWPTTPLDPIAVEVDFLLNQKKRTKPPKIEQRKTRAPENAHSCHCMETTTIPYAGDQL